jgi:hypothetical protein
VHRLRNNTVWLLILAIMLVVFSSMPSDALSLLQPQFSRYCCDKGSSEDHAGDAACSSSACSCVSCLPLAFSQKSPNHRIPSVEAAGDAHVASWYASDYVRSIEYPPNRL